MKKVLFLATTILAGVFAANAQTSQNEFSVGYNFLRSNIEFNRTPVVRFNRDTDSHGISAGYTRYSAGVGDTASVVGLTAEGAVNFKSGEATMATLMGGGVLKARNAKYIQPYARVMGGVARQHVTEVNFRDNSNVSAAFDLGGGIDWKVGKTVALRTGVDYLNTGFGGERQNNFRGTLALVF